MEEEEEQIKEAKERNVGLMRDLAREQAKTARLVENVQLYRNNQNGYILYLEQVRLRRQSPWWWVLLVACTVCMFGAYDKRAYIATALNYASLLLVLRGPYVERNTIPQLIAIIIVALTIKFI
jgi:hypothetical protein